MSWLSEAELKELERTSKREVVQDEAIELLSYSRIQRAGTSIAIMRARGWAPLPDGRAGLFRPLAEETNDDCTEHGYPGPESDTVGPGDPDRER